MRARRVGATEACWRLFEFRNVYIHPTVEAYGIHLPGQRTFVLRNPRLAPTFSNSSPIERYFSRPTQCAHLDFLAYMETFNLRNSLPYLLSILRDMVESESLFTEICGTTGIAASLYRNGRTLHRILGLGVDDAEASERHVKLSKYGPNSQRGELIRSLSLLVVDEASMSSACCSSMSTLSSRTCDASSLPAAKETTAMAVEETRRSHNLAGSRSYLRATTCSCCQWSHRGAWLKFRMERLQSLRSVCLTISRGVRVCGLTSRSFESRNRSGKHRTPPLPTF